MKSLFKFVEQNIFFVIAKYFLSFDETVLPYQLDISHIKNFVFFFFALSLPVNYISRINGKVHASNKMYGGIVYEMLSFMFN